MDAPSPNDNPTTTTLPFALALVGIVAIVGLVAIVFAAAISYTARAGKAEPSKGKPAPTTTIMPDLRKKMLEAYEKAADGLVAQQQPNGAWQIHAQRTMDSRGYTGLIAMALADAPAELAEKYSKNADRALAYLASTQGEDGSFAEEGGLLKTYITGIAMSAMSLREADRVKYADPIKRAIAYIRSNQQTSGPYKGGSGYGDLEYEKGKVEAETKCSGSTTGFAADGMAAAGVPSGDPYWTLVIEFAQRCQNDSEANTDAEIMKRLADAGYKVGNDGGFYYAPLPGENKLDPQKDKDGKLVATSYGSMTYEGLKTYLRAGLKKDDPRVAAAVGWIEKNWRLESHPGFDFDKSNKARGLQGLYYYYLVMARALHAYGEDELKTSDGERHPWAAELGQHVLGLQREGTWKNSNPEWQEGMPILATAYALNVFDVVLKHIK